MKHLSNTQLKVLRDITVQTLLNPFYTVEKYNSSFKQSRKEITIEALMRKGYLEEKSRKKGFRITYIGLKSSALLWDDKFIDFVKECRFKAHEIMKEQLRQETQFQLDAAKLKKYLKLDNDKKYRTSELFGYLGSKPMAQRRTEQHKIYFDFVCENSSLSKI